MLNSRRSKDYSPEGFAEWTAILLAGQRPGIDPLAQYCGVEAKALVKIGGKSMLARVADALLGSGRIGRIVILAQDPQSLLVDDTAALASDPRISYAASDDGIASSIARLAGSAQAPWPVLVTTADHALLTTAMVDEFLSHAGTRHIAVGVGERRNVEAAYPETHRTWLKFKGGQYSGANLFALQGPEVRPALALWSSIEQDRKRGWRILARFGPWLLLRALTRTISFAAAMRVAGRRMGLDAAPVVLSQPEAVMDVDKPSDLDLAERILNARSRAQPVNHPDAI